MPDLCEEYGHLVTSLARKLRHTPAVDADDLAQAGFIGLLRARERFDPAAGVKFETFAAYHIRGAMLDELRAMDWVPRRARVRGDSVPGVRPLAPERDGADLEGLFELASPHSDDRADSLVMEQDAVEAAFAGLRPSEKEMARRYYLEGQTLAQIAAARGVSKARICQHFRGHVYRSVEEHALRYVGARVNRGAAPHRRRAG